MTNTYYKHLNLGDEQIITYPLFFWKPDKNM